MPTNEDHYRALRTALCKALTEYLLSHPEGLRAEVVHHAIVFMTVCTFEEIRPERRAALLQNFIENLSDGVAEIEPEPVPPPPRKDMH